MLLYFFLFLSHFIGESVKLTLTLGCLYNSSSTNDYLYWYKQDGNNSPTFILSRYKLDEGNTPDEYRERFSSTLDSTSRSAPLKIQKLQLSDSAVYYCALQPTVTGNTKTLYKNLWSKDNTILHNIHQRETHTVKLQWFVITVWILCIDTDFLHILNQNRPSVQKLFRDHVKPNSSSMVKFWNHFRFCKTMRFFINSCSNTCIQFFLNETVGQRAATVYRNKEIQTQNVV
uniref:Ig-like domain-containing protein n=1 Tax=Mastacembelus armatus TaxID=205130 RepID=A0A3Q3LNT8_9TELE